jgi:hypothetical protein
VCAYVLKAGGGTCNAGKSTGVDLMLGIPGYYPIYLAFGNIYRGLWRGTKFDKANPAITHPVADCVGVDT